MDSIKPMEKRRGWSMERVAEYNRKRFDDVISAGWDLIVVDEAHRLQGSTEQVARYKLGQGLADAAPYLLLLSATPHQGKSDGFHRLVNLLDADAFPDEASVADISLRLARRLETERQRFWTGNPAKALAKVRQLIGLPKNLPQPAVERGSQSQSDWARVDKFTFQRPDDMPVPALLFRPPGNIDQALDVIVYADDRGMQSAARVNGPIRKLVSESTAVFAVDVRGLGETRDQGSNAKYHSHSHRVGNVATHIGQPLLGQRVRDLLAVVDYLNEVGSERVRSIRMVGVGAAAPVALHAAALDARISEVELRNPTVSSWVKDVLAQPLRREMVDHVVPGALAWYDLPDLARQLGARLRTR